MAFWRGSLVLVSFILATHSLARIGGQDVVLPNGKLSEGEALELFLQHTLPGNNFERNKTCSWNETLIVCDSQHSKVLRLNFSGMSLTGPIPEGTISNLTGLEYLDLSNNQLDGSLPKVYQLPNLTDIMLSRNNFAGPLSDNNLPPNLLRLDLSMNRISGSIPSSLVNLDSLISLKLGSNYLSENINLTVLTAKAKLQVLDLSSNMLLGNIPPSLPSNLSSFDLHNNRFQGNVTELTESLKFVDSRSLKLLDLSSNNFEDQDFPPDFTHLANLATLSLAGNKFFSHSFPTLPTVTLVNLNFSRTNLSGNIPEWICNLTSLVSLDLSDNDLNGSIPSRIGALYQLELLDLSKNLLSGIFPPNSDNLTFVSVFNVSYNNLSGVIPTGNQFSTYSNTSFVGNPSLCGFPLTVSCESPFSVEGSSGNGKSTNTGAVISSAVSGLVVLLVFCAALVTWCRMSSGVKHLGKDEATHVSGPMQYEKDAETWATGVKDPTGITVVMFEKPLLHLSFADLLLATGSFSKEMQMADDGYGPVYKGVLSDGTPLAVKVLAEVGFSDEKRAAAKIEGLAKVKHSNLVSLIGYCLVGEDSVLIYEYMVNGDLQQWLHELPEGIRNPDDWSLDSWEQLEGVEISGEFLTWPTRHRIALGTARALAFLHHGCCPHVIHRDVKSSNILLDDAFEAHLVDSGLAGMARMNGTPIVGGTLGYVPPEYGQTWQATTRGDVYSFGVVLLELVTGRKPTGQCFHDSYGGSLVGWVRSMIKRDKRGQKALDPKLVSRGYVPEMLEVLRIGYLCTSEIPAKRPNMQQVVGLLKDCHSGFMY